MERNHGVDLVRDIPFVARKRANVALLLPCVVWTMSAGMSCWRPSYGGGNDVVMFEYSEVNPTLPWLCIMATCLCRRDKLGTVHVIIVHRPSIS